ncbi:hypothetical protein MOB80_01670 [Bacillus inaquosorum]|uniref:YobI family P-loop NTPase n=1 Tax=Bacillus inaquosorum TaxID=483913 RepID=UPI002280E1D6|nr:hypothetical protein [Bacillus inaquosorum]MCY8282757.1 hypothetical protein [Bacillus inaquosorum]
MGKIKQKIVQWLQILLTKLEEPEVKKESLYEDLTPSNDVDTDGKYSEAISWGLENKKVKNIALTGPYGSGKSSLLNTFQEQHSNEYSFLKISLATFQPNKNEEVENKLEKSILQQMIYRVHNRTIPFSRFKRIKHIRPKIIILQLFFFFAFILVTLYLLKPDVLQGLYDKTLVSRSLSKGDQQQVALTVVLLLFFIGYPLISFGKIYHFIRANLRLNKVTIANTTLERSAGDENSSIFDKYLDEILYFFEASKYNVVIFEDLDRFNNIDIFEKLRELNELINNSEQVNRRIVFIYAIKDDIFGKKDDDDLTRNRTKFFDFIVPVIPIINASNSGDVLIKKIKRSPYSDKINIYFLEDVTIYIDDMRVLKNIFNEFVVYQQKLRVINLDSNKLLAMVIYKNIYPIDFSGLQHNKGLIYEVFQKKELIIEKHVNLIDEKIKQINTKIKKVENEALTSIDELQMVYWECLNLSKLHRFDFYVELDNTRYNSNTENIASFFEVLKNAKHIKYYLNNRGQGTATVNDIATIFNTKRNYFEREEAIKIIEKNQIQELKKELSQLKKEKQEIGAQSLQALIAKNDVRDVLPAEIYEKKLLVYLLRHGYIDEMYNHYITYFYPESLSLSDIKFVFSIKNHESLPHNYQLENTGKIMKKLVGDEFKQKEALNFHLLNYIMDHSEYRSYYDNIIERLANGSDESVTFIDGFKDRATNKSAFIQSLSSKWDDFWSFIELRSNYTQQKKEEYLSDILAYADIADIIRMNKESVMSSALSKHLNFLSLVSDEEKIKELLLKLQVKFKSLDHLLNSETIYDFVVQRNLYEINIKTLSVILNDAPDITYAAVKNSGQQAVINYVNENIDLFVKKVLLNDEIDEPEESLLELLNWEDLDEEIKRAIIMKKTFAISDISELIKELWPIVIRENKMVACWPNVITSYVEYNNKITDFLTAFLNNPANRKELSKNNIEAFDDEFDEAILEDISEEIINSRDITDETFEVLIASIHCWVHFPSGNVTEKRAKLLIDNDLLSLTSENFKELKSNFDTLHIQLVVRNSDEFIEKQGDFSLDSNDVKQLIDSNDFPQSNKEIFVQQLNSNFMADGNKDILNDTIYFINEHNLKITNELLTFLLESSTTLDTRLSLLTGQIKHIDNELITEFLTIIGEPYSEIAEKGRRIKISNNRTNKALVTALESKNYISSFKEDREKLRVNTKKK